MSQQKGENDRKKIFMIYLYERMLPDPAGIEPTTSWLPVEGTSNWATETGYFRRQFSGWGMPG